MEKQLKEIIRFVIREEFVSELSKNDVHVKEIMKFYDKGTYSTKKAVSIFVSGKPNATRNQILDDLADMGYNDAWEVMDHFKLTIESTQLDEGFGDTIKKIRNLAIRMASTKFDRAKSHLDIDKIASSDSFDGKDAMNKATSALLQQSEINEDLKSAINKIAVKLGTGSTMLGIITALVSMSGWIQYLDSSFTKWYYTEIQKLAEPQVMQIMQDLGKSEGTFYGKLGMYAFFIFFTIAVISLVAARMTQKPKNEADVVPGGLAKGLSLNDIAEKHGVSVDMMVAEFKKGIAVEMEHTTDREVAKEITLDHLFEDPKYYDKLKKVEEYVDDKGVEHVGAALPQTEEEPVNEALVKGKTYGGSKCEGGCFVGKTGLMKIIKISKDSPKDVFMFRDDNYSGLQPHFIKNGVIAKATVINPAYDLEKHKVRNLKIDNDVILSVRLFVSTNESVNESNDCGCN